MMGAPIIVYAKSLGASSTTLGIIAAFTPLMTVFQLPAAQHLHRFGYRQFVLMGWGMRNVLIFWSLEFPWRDSSTTPRNWRHYLPYCSSSIFYAASRRPPGCHGSCS